MFEDIVLGAVYHGAVLRVVQYRDTGFSRSEVHSEVASLASEVLKGNDPHPAVILASVDQGIQHYRLDICIPLPSTASETKRSPSPYSNKENHLEFMLDGILDLYTDSPFVAPEELLDVPQDVFSGALSEAISDTLSEALSSESSESYDPFYYDSLFSPSHDALFYTSFYLGKELSEDVSANAPTNVSPANLSPTSSLSSTLPAPAPSPSPVSVNTTPDATLNATPNVSPESLSDLSDLSHDISDGNCDSESDCSFDSLSDSSWDLLKDYTFTYSRPSTSCVLLHATDTDRALVWAKSFDEACSKEGIDITSAVYSIQTQRPLYDQVLLVKRGLAVMEALGSRVVGSDPGVLSVQDLGVVEFSDGTCHPFGHFIHHNLRWNIATFNVKLDLYRKSQALTAMSWDPTLSTTANSGICVSVKTLRYRCIF
ncbi:hypothetical protein V5O48_015352 [Marasmius crinis-equi]|uniref:Uncharacterized protein n=1 Tax=Marasmius crinis-equi TaxID=585013 RepID=A0ABR3EUT0_9AGAR